ncbi:MAG TPA: AraC family transcriptional regulator, partial [Labilithrix sp.]|nr:AraC family transcriptional regulator [Labilithrix sp.]
RTISKSAFVARSLSMGCSLHGERPGGVPVLLASLLLSMLLTRAPTAKLRPFVQSLWAIDTRKDSLSPRARSIKLERVLPTGAMHLVVRLSPAPLVLFDDASGARSHAVAHSVIGGARSTFYVRSISEPVHSVGVQLRPGAAAPLLGVPANELAETHTPLDDVWGQRAALTRERLATARSLAAQLDILEDLLVSQLTQGTKRDTAEIHPAVAEALVLFEAGAPVAEAVRRSGYSHRTFLTLFQRSVGLSPKVFARIRRFQRALDRLTRERPRLVDLAADAGYADQAHLTREFTELAGMTPAEHRALDLVASNHVPIRP